MMSAFPTSSAAAAAAFVVTGPFSDAGARVPFQEHHYHPVEAIKLSLVSDATGAQFTLQQANLRHKEAVRTHPQSVPITEHGDQLRAYALRETRWFMIAYQKIYAQKQAPIQVMGSLNLGSLTNPHWTPARITALFRQDYRESIPSDITHFHLFYTRMNAWLMHYSGQAHPTFAHYVFACDPAFTQDDVTLLRSSGITAFPYTFSPDSKGDAYKTNSHAQHHINTVGALTDNPSWIANHKEEILANVTSVFMAPHCPSEIRYDSFLGCLTFLDLGHSTWEEAFDLLLWAIRHDKLHNLILLYQNPFEYRPNAKGLNNEESWAHWLTGRKYSGCEQSLIKECFKHAQVHGDCPVLDQRAPNLSLLNAKNKKLLWWCKGDRGGFLAEAHGQWPIRSVDDIMCSQTHRDQRNQRAFEQMMNFGI